MAGGLEHLRCFEDPGPLTVGFTATPGHGDGRALSAVWQEIVHEYSLLSGIVGGYLCDVRGQIAGTSMDLSNVRQVAGDYSASWLAREMERSEAIPQIADAWLKHGQGRKTLAFTPDVATAHELAAALRERGVAAEAADGSTDAGIRRDILARFKRGETQVAVNCGLWTEGFDEPSVACVLIARPTRSKVLFAQMAAVEPGLTPVSRTCCCSMSPASARTTTCRPCPAWPGCLRRAGRTTARACWRPWKRSPKAVRISR